MRRIGIVLVLGAVIGACADGAVDTTTTGAPGTTAATTTTIPATTTAPSTTSEPTTTTSEGLPFGGYPVAVTRVCVIDHLSNDALNVRSGPGTQYGVVGTLAYDALAVPATGLGADDDQGRGWLEVQHGGGTGWAAGWLLTPCEAGVPGVYTVIDTPCPDALNIRVGPGGGFEAVGQFPCHTFDVAATGASARDGNGRTWLQVRFDGEVGWSAGWFLTPTAFCEDGWISPAPGSDLWVTGLGHIGVSTPGVVDPADFVVEVMLYCVGPEDANIIAPRRDVERWYIKGFASSDPTFRSRWITRRIPIGQGLAWVAPYPSTGFGSGIWEDCYDHDRVGLVFGDFCLPGAAWDPMATSCYLFLPGAWVPGDCDGLPPEVLAGLAGY